MARKQTMAKSLRQWKKVLPEKYHKELDRLYAKKINHNNSTNSVANVEQTFGNEPLEQKTGEGFTSPVHIHVHSIRKRLADPDGISCKAVLDGIVKAGVLQDDNVKYVEGVSYSQEQGEDCTIITITEGQ